MMFNQPYRSSTEEESSDVETASSVASYTTSKTTATDSWHDVKSDTEEQQQLNKIKNLDDEGEGTLLDDDTDDDDDDDDEDDDNRTDQDLIRSIKDIYTNSEMNVKVENKTATGSDLHNIPIGGEQKQQTRPEWSNPYWGADSKSSTTAIKPIINGNKDTSDIQR